MATRQLVKNGVHQGGDVFTIMSNGIPASYTKQTGNGILSLVKKGQTNLIAVRPQIINEHCESHSIIQDVVDATTIVGQIFKASQNNINGVVWTLGSAAGATLDDFESYADSAALRVQWVKTGTNEANLETTIIPPGSTKSMNLPADILNDEWADTFVAVNYTGYIFSLDYYQDVSFIRAQVSFFVEDSSANTASILLTIAAQDSWEHFDIGVGALSDDGAATDMADIVKIGFRVDVRDPSANAYVDNIIALPPPGDVEAKLWDFGPTLPTAGADGLNNAAQYTELGDRGVNSGTVTASKIISLSGDKKQYQVDSFIAGVAKEESLNTLLTVGNYYAITLHYVDTDVNVYGSGGTSNCYNNGYSFTAPDEVSPITAVGADQDCMFIIYSTQDVYVVTTFWAFFTSANIPAITGQHATHSIFIEDTSEKISDILVTTVKAGAGFVQLTELRPMYMEQGGKYEMYYTDDVNDNVYAVQFAFGYLYQPMNVNG